MNSRSLTKEETQEKFLNVIRHNVDYWLNESRIQNTKDKLEGLAFSILSILDGCGGSLPAFKVIPMPHPDDKEFLISQGENYFPDDIDIATNLHELFLRH